MIYKPATEHLKLGNELYDPVEAADFPQTILRYKNQPAADSVGLGHLSDQEWVEYFGHFQPLPDNLPQPLALRYHGHQFRIYNPELGDGRGFLFAQLYDEQNRLLDLGSKGSGQTPWSRSGDGRLTLKGGVREVLATEMLTAHGVNTSKSFSLIETGEQLYRNDEPSPARSAVLVRLSHSHIRIGTFQRLLYFKDHKRIEQLAHYCIDHYWPEVKEARHPILAFFKQVVKAVAKMAAQWFVAGFVHGVLNTDNITITGESFDYGPWRFLPNLDPNFTAAYFDHSRLYAFGRQPDALKWNLARFAECLIPLCDIHDLKNAMADYDNIFELELQFLTFNRLGVMIKNTKDTMADPFIPQFYQALKESGMRYEQAFFDLTCGADSKRLQQSPNARYYQDPSMKKVIAALKERQSIPNAGHILNHKIMQSDARAITLLINEVEAIWDSIANDNDWTAFEKKISEIRSFGALNSMLTTSEPH